MAKIGGQRAVVALDVGREKEPLAVFVDGKASGTAKLILPVDAGGVVQSVIGSQSPAAVILVSFSVKIIGAGLGDDIEEAAGGTSEFRSEAVSDDLELLDGFDGDGEVLRFEGAKVFAEEIVSRVRAVNDETIVVALLAAHERMAQRRPGTTWAGGSQLRKVAVIAARERRLSRLLESRSWVMPEVVVSTAWPSGFSGNGDALLGGLEASCERPGRSMNRW